MPYIYWCALVQSIIAKHLLHNWTNIFWTTNASLIAWWCVEYRIGVNFGAVHQYGFNALCMSGSVVQGTQPPQGSHGDTGFQTILCSISRRACCTGYGENNDKNNWLVEHPLASLHTTTQMSTIVGLHASWTLLVQTLPPTMERKSLEVFFCAVVCDVGFLSSSLFPGMSAPNPIPPLRLFSF